MSDKSTPENVDFFHDLRFAMVELRALAPPHCKARRRTECRITSNYVKSDTSHHYSNALALTIALVSVDSLN